MKTGSVFIILLAALSFSSCGIGEGDPLDHARGTFVAWTSNNNVVVSEDGVTWRDLGNAGFYFYSMANNDSFIVGSLASAPWSFAVSSDLINWTHYSAPNSQLAGAVMVDGMIYFAGGDTGTATRCVFRYDGTQLATVYNSGESGSMSSIAYGAGRFVGVGTDMVGTNNIYYSNGSSWTAIDLNYSLHHVIYAHDRFIAVGSDGSSNPIVISSRDGSSWSTNLVPSGPTYVVNRIVYGGGRYVAIGNIDACYSEDGFTWSHYLSIVPPSIHGIAYGNRAFVSVGDNGLIYRSEDGIHWVNVYNNSSVGSFQDVTLLHNYSLED